MSSSVALPKQYDPSEVEARWLRFWLENDYFHSDESTATVPYAMTLPPPNVTGSLHIGHALGSTMQDILIRWRRMQGFNAMWMPGTDHASIAVHHLLERDLKRREGKTRFDLGRDEFLRRAWLWKEKSGHRISEQEKLMGFSLDWQRERFTMDEGSNRAVREAFVKLHEDGLIFRAMRMINWDPVSETVVSDLEVDVVDESGSLWEIKYPIVGGGEIVVATTRPETMLGDTAVAGTSRRREISRMGRQAGGVAAHRPAHPDRGRQFRRSRVWIGRREDHSGARSERLRVQSAARVGGPAGD
jgi:valyl-tRNA synthetase